MEFEQHAAMHAAGQVNAGGGVGMGLKVENYWRIECHDRDGNLKWVDEFANLVTTVGMNDLLTQYFKGSAYTAAWYVGLTAGTPTFAAGDTMSSHSGWTEVTAYSEGARQTLTLGTPSGGSVNNTASKAVFTISSNGTTIGGAFVVTNSTKGGTSGTIYGGGALGAGNKTIDNGDTLSVTVTLTVS